jgi:hypothetical protein
MDSFSLATDLPALEVAIRAVTDCRLVVIDPITAYTGGTDSHKNAEVRGLLAPLSELAAKHRVAIVCVTHLNKNASGPAIYRSMGSLAFAAAARAVWGVVKDKEKADRRLFLPVKNNLAGDTQGLAYSFEFPNASGPPVVTWEREAVTISADDAMSGEPKVDRNRVRKEAAEWLKTNLADGAIPSVDLFERAKESGISVRTLRRAARGIGVHMDKRQGHWQWKLPKAAKMELDDQRPTPK